MQDDVPPAETGMPHPLYDLAPAATRGALSDALVSCAGQLLDAWERYVRRIKTPPLVPLPREAFEAALAAYRDLLDSGSLYPLDALFDNALSDGGYTHRAMDEAARLNRMLTALTVAAQPVLHEAMAEDAARYGEAMALLLGATHLASTSLYNALERCMVSEVRAVQERQLRFYQEITRLATNNRLRLVDPHEIPAPQGGPVPIREPRDGGRLRRAAAQLAFDIQMSDGRRDDLTLAVGEAVSNVLKHAGQGIGHVWESKGVVYVFISDTGRGITLDDLPKALTPGWSSAPSLGMGFTLMLEMVDILWLATGASGTTVCVEKSAGPRSDPLLETLLQDN